MSNELSPEARKAVEQIEKLLRHAGKTTNETEAATFTQKAQDLLAKFNLDMSIVEANSGDKGKREDTKLAGGLYHYQRDLWDAVAKLNFCLYWNQYRYDKEKSAKRHRPSYTFQHRLVGRSVNVVATRVMAEYLEATIERLTRERMVNPAEFFTRYATSYREGISARVQEKIYKRRQHLIREEERKAHEAAEIARKAARSGVSTSTALTLGTLAQSEKDANMDFIYGEGWSAKRRLEEVERARAQTEAEEAYTQWAEANPEEAKKEAKEERKRRRSYSSGPQSYADRKQRDNGAYYAGYDVGDKVSIDQQAGGRKTAGLLK